MREYKAVLFDVDGTLLDTTEFIFQSYEHTLAAYGLPRKPRSEIALLIGQSLEYCYQVLTGIDDVRELAAAHRSFQAKNLHLAQAYPGTHETLAMLQDEGIRMAAVTTRSRRTVVQTLEVAGIANYLEIITALEDVENLKPHPEPVLKTLAYLDVEPLYAAMVGDTDVDVLAGKNAGTMTVSVTYGFHGRQIVESDPDYVIDDISELIPVVLPALEVHK